MGVVFVVVLVLVVVVVLVALIVLVPLVVMLVSDVLCTFVLAVVLGLLAERRSELAPDLC